MTVVIDGTTGIDTIQNNTVTSAKIVDGAVTGQDIAGGAGAGNLTITQANQTPLPGVATVISYTHGLGVTPVAAEVEIVCLTADAGYAAGDILTNPATGNAFYGLPFQVIRSTTTVQAVTSTTAPWLIINKTTGVMVTPTSANWAWRFKVRTA